MSNDCSQHKKEVAGISDMKVLAEMIGDLHYETLSHLLHHLSKKINTDAVKDYKEGRTKLSLCLDKAQRKLFESSLTMKDAFEISKPFMNK
jgi:hypothetical protein